MSELGQRQYEPNEAYQRRCLRRVASMPLVEFLELISLADFKFRYEPNDPKTRGIEGRHKILKEWIAKLKIESVRKGSKGDG